MAGVFGGGFMAGSIVGKLLLDKSGWNASVKAVEKDKRALSGVARDVGMKMQNMGKAMSIAGLAIVGIFTGAIKAFADFDEAMTESLAIMGDVSDAMKTEMADAAKQMSGESTFAAKELAGAYFYLASAGLDAEQSIAALPVVTKFAEAGTFDLSKATDLLTDAQSALGLSVKDAIENQENMIDVSDVLVAANTLANATVLQFSEALTNKAGPAMRAYDVALEEGVAVLAAFADQGVKGSEAGSAFSIVLRDLQRAAIANKKAFKAAGIAVYDADGNLNNLGDTVGQLEEHLGDMSAEQKKTTLGMLGFQERSQSFLLTLIGTSEKIKDYEKNLKSAGGITQEVSDKNLKALSKQLKMAKNEITVTAISLGEDLAPMIIECKDEIVKIIKKIQDWVKEHPDLTEWIGKTGLKLGALLVVIGPLLIVLPKLAAGFALVWTAITGPAALVVAALAGIVLAINDLVKTHKKALDDMSFNAKMAILDITTDGYTYLAMLSEVQKEGGEILEDWKDLTFQFGADYVGMFAKISTDPAFADLKIVLDEIIEKQGDLKKEGGDLNKVNIELAGSLADLVAKGTLLKDVVTDTDEGTGALNETLGITNTKIKRLHNEGLVALIDKFVNAQITVDEFHDALKDLGKYNFKQWLETNFPMAEMTDALAAYIAEWESTPSALQSVFHQIGLHSLDLQTEIEKHTEKMTKKVESLWDQMADGLQTKWASTIGEVLRGATSLKDGLKGVWDAILVQFTDMIGAMIAKWMTDFVGKIIDGAKSAGQEIAESIGGAIGGADSDSVADAFDSVGKGASGLLNTLSGIANIVTAVASVANLFKKTGPSSTDSWHFEHIWMNVKDLNDYVRINVREFLIRIIDRLNTNIHKIEYTMKQNRTANSFLKDIAKNTANMVTAIGNIPSGQSGLDFYSGSSGGLVRYHAMENVSIQPASQPNINISSAPVRTEVPIYLNGREIMRAIAKDSVKFSQHGHIKWHQRGNVS